MPNDEDSGSLEGLRQNWELASVRHFFALFGKKIDAPPVDYEDIELMCVSPMESHLFGTLVQTLLPEAMKIERYIGDARDLKALNIKMMHRLDEGIGDFYDDNPMRKPKLVKQKSRSVWGKKRRRKRRDEPEEEEEGSGEEAAGEGAPSAAAEAEEEAEEEAELIRFEELPAEARVNVLRVLCELCCEESDPVWEHCNQHVREVRLTPVGTDVSNCNILHMHKDDTRLFREHQRAAKRGRKEPPAPKFDTLCTTLQELEAVADGWRTARGRQQKNRKLAQYVDTFLPGLQASDRAKRKANEVALLPRRKSDRAAFMERKQLEESRAEERRSQDQELKRREHQKKKEEEERLRERERREAEEAAVVFASAEMVERERLHRLERQERMRRRAEGLPAMCALPEPEPAPAPAPAPSRAEGAQRSSGRQQMLAVAMEQEDLEKKRQRQLQDREAFKIRQRVMQEEMAAHRLAQQEADAAAAKYRADRMARRAAGLPAEPAPVPRPAYDYEEDLYARPKPNRQPKNPKKRARANKTHYEVDESIQCACGVQADTGVLMIACTACENWSHAACVGFDTQAEVPEDFRCRMCRLCGRQPNSVNSDAGTSSGRQRKPSSRLVSYIEQTAPGLPKAVRKQQEHAAVKEPPTQLWVQCDHCLKWLEAREEGFAREEDIPDEFCCRECQARRQARKPLVEPIERCTSGTSLNTDDHGWGQQPRGWGAVAPKAAPAEAHVAMHAQLQAQLQAQRQQLQAQQLAHRQEQYAREAQQAAQQRVAQQQAAQQAAQAAQQQAAQLAAQPQALQQEAQQEASQPLAAQQAAYAAHLVPQQQAAQQAEQLTAQQAAQQQAALAAQQQAAQQPAQHQAALAAQQAAQQSAQHQAALAAQQQAEQAAQQSAQQAAQTAQQEAALASLQQAALQQATQHQAGEQAALAVQQEAVQQLAPALQEAVPQEAVVPQQPMAAHHSQMGNFDVPAAAPQFDGFHNL